MKKILSIVSIMVICLCTLILSGCGSNNSDVDKEIEALKKEAETIQNDLNDIVESTIDSIEVGDDIEEEEVSKEDTEDMNTEKASVQSFASEAKEDSSPDDPIKFGEVAKALIQNTVYYMEDPNKKAPIYLKAVKKVSEEEALADLRAYNEEKGEGSIYAHEEKLDKFVWKEVLFEIDYKDYPTLSSGSIGAIPTFSVHKDPSDYASPLCDCFYIGEKTSIFQGDVLKVKVLYQWPIGKDGKEILKISKDGSFKEYVYFLIEE